jgi:broad specificity phosphatase PhoE
MEVVKKLYFVRHGETPLNSKMLFSGQTETPLTDKGIAQAKATAKLIKKNIPKIDLIIASPYERTTHTARIIAAEIKYPLDKIIFEKMLIERSYGDLEGTSTKKYFKPDRHMKIDHIETVETIKDLQIRAKKALEIVKSFEDHDVILIVGHGSFGRALYRVAKDLPHTHEFKLFFPIDNAKLLELF